ncbi:MAG: bifunctional [glutamate--ammonia ligase]-adenylyl-L-tyrosine phosphorylase/[glutamate--ammonia-ligase] adenylyltransferase [Deltaproteobacteria bacterium]|nr:bifunctional [glutamate--ammonia ligase]-adenylyl-L-tyrosine phosphorylase/[glutamate--ammonia-ligase] adenylyltransferase [Deltaproteobacteria bacterium]
MVNEILGKGDSGAEADLRGLGFSDGRRALNNLKLLSRTPLHGSLDAALKAAMDAPSPDGALNNLETITRDIPPELLLESLKDPRNLERLVTICGSSPYLSNILSQNPDFFGWLFLGGGLWEKKDAQAMRAELTDKLTRIDGFEPFAKALRDFKQKQYLRIGSRDLLGLSDVEEVTAELSDLASVCVDEALRFSIQSTKALFGAPLYTDYDGTAKEAELTVIGLGKLGGRELNFSSDIDIIYIYSSDKGETTGVEGRNDSSISLHAFFVKAATMLNKLISNITADGFVFRIDLDLRPEGRSGDMANSLRSAEVYYESWGQTWERAAMIKARPVAGSLALGADFLKMTAPFVFRRYLDFTAIEEIKSMKEKIDLSLLRRSPDTIDVKLGAGGIREIEFFCQALQLIHGGKNPSIREKGTLKAIKILTKEGFLKDTEAGRLREGYIFLRRLEHRIQIVEGRQTQAIPARAEELERLARMMGFKDTAEKKAGEFFWEEYKEVTSSIHEVFRSLFYRSEEEALQHPKDILILLSVDITEAEAREKLSGLGFKDTESAFKNLSLLKTGPPFVHLSARARVLFQRLAPGFLSSAASSPDPDRALQHLERFISSIGARTTFYSLLAENQAVADELIKLFGTSVFLSRTMIERPESLDLLLSKELAVPCRTKKETLELFLAEAEDEGYEERLDNLRRLKNQEVFRVGVNDVRGTLTPKQVSRQMTFIAEACLEASLKIALKELIARYGEPCDSFAIIGLGKLGASELIYGSDLDILFVYSGNGEDMTSGPREITSHEFFVKLGQRIISILTLRTKEGFVFNVDARLRPSGSAGPLVVSRDSLIKYHGGKTLVWERQALIRARAVAGDVRFGKETVRELEEIIYSKPLTEEEIDEMLRVRKRMEVEIAKEGPDRYNIKTGKGGMVDIEFLAQAIQLKWGRRRGMRTPGTLKALLRASGEGIIPKEDYDFLKEAYTLFRLLETRLRIVHDRPEGYLEAGSEELTTLAKRAGYKGDDAARRLLDDYASCSGRVRELYIKTLQSLANGQTKHKETP